MQQKSGCNSFVFFRKYCKYNKWLSKKKNVLVLHFIKYFPMLHLKKKNSFGTLQYAQIICSTFISTASYNNLCLYRYVFCCCWPALSRSSFSPRRFHNLFMVVAQFDVISHVYQMLCDMRYLHQAFRTIACQRWCCAHIK